MKRENIRFADRAQAGRALAKELARMNLDRPVVLALPRGGVPVGYEVARALDAPMDVVMVRKIGAPGHEEYSIGALVDGACPHVVIDEAAARGVGASNAYIDQVIASELAEIERRRAAYCAGPPLSLKGRTVIVVDDGIATGNTAQVALEALAEHRPGKIILAVPVAPRDSLHRLRSHCDDIVCLGTPEPFFAVGAHYVKFDQTSDEEVIASLAKVRELVGGETGG